MPRTVVPRATKYHEKGYSYLKKDPNLKDWDFCYHIHKNQNGTHFDLRMYCPGGDETVYSWSSKKNVLSKNYPSPIRRSKDHSIKWLSFEGEYTSKKGHKNVLKIVDSGPAELIDVGSDFFIFKITDKLFKLKHLRGKKYLYCPIENPES